MWDDAQVPSGEVSRDGKWMVSWIHNGRLWSDVHCMPEQGWLSKGSVHKRWANL